MDFNMFIKCAKGILSMQLFEINQTPITVASVLLFVTVLICFSIASQFITRVLLGRVLRRLHMDEGTRYTLQRVTHYIIMLIGALVSFQFMGIDLSGLMVVFGFLSVGIGFGLQNLTSNFAAGLILLVERPIRVGDRVIVGDTEGDVVEINIRSTTIRSTNNISIIVPNSEFVSSRVVNMSHRDPTLRIEVNVGVSYDSDLNTVIQCLAEIAAANTEVLKTPTPEVLHKGFGDSAWNMRLRCWIADPKRHEDVQSDIHCAIVRTFRAKGIEIPYPQRDVHIRSGGISAETT